MPPSIYTPTQLGFAALDELEAVPWAELAHAYGTGVTGTGIHDDVARCLRALTGDEANQAVGDGLYSNICHQGTVYQATAYAVPFVVAVAASEIDHELRRSLVWLVGHIALGATFATEDGCHAGAYGDDVGPSIRVALTRSAERLHHIATIDPSLAPVIQAIVANVANPDEPTFEHLAQVLDA
jgi:hypothetical protein